MTNNSNSAWPLVTLIVALVMAIVILIALFAPRLLGL
jgi:hypothetical protein